MGFGPLQALAVLVALVVGALGAYPRSDTGHMVDGLWLR
jgi:hypothetical protein